MSMNRIDSTSLHNQGALEAFRGPQRRDDAAGKTAADEPAGGATAQSLGDRVEISDKAMQLVDLRAALDTGLEAVAAEPELRAERLAEVRERLATGFHNAAEVKAKVAGGVDRVFRGIEEL